MTRPQRYLVRMALFLLAVAGIVGVLLQGLLQVFLVSPALNGMILGVLLLGIIFVFRQVALLGPEVRWIEKFRQGLVEESPPRLLSPMATMLTQRMDRISLSAIAMRSLLDGIGARLDESREISRYLIGLLIFLGLLGTFWGLLQTVNTVGGVIAGLSFGDGDLAGAFESLKRGLGGPLSGMGTAFGTSLFGLAGSLVLGFLDLQLGQAQNRFFNDLEEWLSSLTRLGASGPLSDSGGGESVPAYLQALIEHTADSLENLQRTIARGEENRKAANSSIIALTDKLSALTDQMRAEQSLMIKLAEGQMEIRPVLVKLAEAASHSVIDEPTRAHIRNIDIYIARLLEELSTGRAHTTEELRAEIRLLARTIAALAEEAR